jgi:hypothetical protein
VLSVQRCRQILGDEATNLSDQDIERLREAMGVLADVAIAAMVRHVPPWAATRGSRDDED